jgi:hypothetical protein
VSERALRPARWFLGLLLATLACRPQAAPKVTAERAYAAPAPLDRGELCSDLRGERVCWDAGRRLRVPRPLPSGPQPPAGFRCGGMAGARVCADRAHNGSAFDCQGQRCLQARPRMPDDSEWDCVEMNGVVFCRGRADAAGIAAGPLDLGWLCGERRGVTPLERICVDLDSDRPVGAAEFQCAFEYPHGQPQRVCVPASAPRIGSACGPTRPCPAAASCSDGRCLPARPEPACWYDKDCGAAAVCRWGSCERSAT